MEHVLLNRLEAELSASEQVTKKTALNDFLAEVQTRAYHVAYGALWDKETALDVVQEAVRNRIVNRGRIVPPAFVRIGFPGCGTGRFRLLSKNSCRKGYRKNKA